MYLDYTNKNNSKMKTIWKKSEICPNVTVFLLFERLRKRLFLLHRADFRVKESYDVVLRAGPVHFDILKRQRSRAALECAAVGSVGSGQQLLEEPDRM